MIHTCNHCGKITQTTKRFFVCGCAGAVAVHSPSHWLPLHQYAVDHSHDWDGSAAKTFFDKWNASVSGCGSCRVNWDTYIIANPPDFISAEAFFRWGVHAHNHVSANHVKPPKPTMDVETAWNLYAGPYYQPVASDLELLALRTKDKLVVTVATGDQYEQLLWDYTAAPMKAYADRIGADFIALTGVTQKWWGLEKFRVGPLAAHWDRTLFVDADVLIRTDAPDIFDEVPIGSIGMANDWAVQGDHNWHRIEREKLWESQGVPPLYPEYMRNTGVVVVDSMHADIWTPPTKPMPENHVDEQFWVERWTRFYDFHELSLQWNTQWYYSDFQVSRNAAYFLHFACCPMPARIKEITKELSTGNIRHTSPSEITKMTWDELKANPVVTPYPENRPAIPKDTLGWSTPNSLTKIKELAAELPPNKVVIELGCFLGAVSTQALLQGNPDIFLVCVDKFFSLPEWIPEEGRPQTWSAFLNGVGNQWEHFVNNTWDDQHRIAPMVADASPFTLRMLHRAGLDVGLIYVDADHAEEPVYEELMCIPSLWPQATIVLDDYNSDWPGIPLAFKRAQADGAFKETDTFEVFEDRLLIIRRNQQ